MDVNGGCLDDNHTGLIEEGLGCNPGGPLSRCLGEAVPPVVELHVWGGVQG